MSKYKSIQCREQYRDCPTGHASLKEHRRWQELVLLEKAGEIRNLRQQVAYELVPAVTLNGRRKPAIRYVADFVYEAEEHNHAECQRRQMCGLLSQTVIEDAKGVATPMFRLKAHLMKAVHGVDVRLT